MGLPSELRLRVAYGQGDSLVEPSVLAHPSPRHLASPRHSPRVRSISPITSPRLLEPSPIVAGKALDSQQRDVHQPRRSSTSGDATEQFQNQKAMAVGEQMTAASPPFTGSIQGHGPDEGEYESEWVVRLRLEGHQDVAHVREESALKVSSAPTLNHARPISAVSASSAQIKAESNNKRTNSVGSDKIVLNLCCFAFLI